MVFTKAYVVKKIGVAGSAAAPSGGQKTGQVSWSKFGGPVGAWAETKARANF